MELYLIRHAIALPAQGEGEAADDARPLAPEGVRRFRKVVRGLKALGVALDLVLASPKRRARETADLLTPLLAGPPSAALLAELPQEGRVALVGHEPYLSELLGWLLFGDFVGDSAREALAERFLFKKGGVAWLEGRPRPGEVALRAFLPPKVFRI